MLCVILRFVWWFRVTYLCQYFKLREIFTFVLWFNETYVMFWFTVTLSCLIFMWVISGPTGDRVGKKAPKISKHKVSHTSQNTVRDNKISQPEREVNSEIKSVAEENKENECERSEGERVLLLQPPTAVASSSSTATTSHSGTVDTI